MERKTIAVFGATGSQGGSVVRHLVDSREFDVRALTRQPDAYSGPADDVRHADLDDPASLATALSGAQGVFLVTNFWQPGTDEIGQARRAVAAARENGVEHFVWSTLPDVASISGGRWTVPHFTMKSKVNQIVARAGFRTHTFVEPAFYFESLLTDFAPRPLPSGHPGWALPIDPDARVIHMGSVAELGALVLGVFRAGHACHGKTLSMAGGKYSFRDIAVEIGKVTGTEPAFDRVPPEVFAGFFPQAPEVANMLGYFEEFTYFGPGGDERVREARDVAGRDFMAADRWIRTNMASTGPATGMTAA